ncbi:Uncharacterised protein [Candidatus Venteria ishoeyi]|uniref:Secretion system C-terminal sorting domain-containing protein n=1 Tax=Candidatus Venteria ishoeyi TaxID=1899563 RepID=A0A1H6F7K2_9GAMM|nr:Uncharacterised protein [Candidatus Venteria ishoeyi]
MYLSEDLKHDIIIYPNPASSELNVELPFYSNNFEVEIYDLLGRSYFQFQNSTYANSTKMDISNLNTGMYIITVSIDKRIFSKRLFIR